MKTQFVIIGSLLALFLLIGCGTIGSSSGGHRHIVQKSNNIETVQK